MTYTVVETSLPTPMTARVYVNLLEGNCFWISYVVLISCDIIWYIAECDVLEYDIKL